MLWNQSKSIILIKIYFFKTFLISITEAEYCLKYLDFGTIKKIFISGRDILKYKWPFKTVKIIK